MKSVCIKSWTGFLKKSPVVARIASDGDTNHIYHDEFTFSHSRNPTGQPRRRRERHKGWAMMNWMQLASPCRSPEGFVTRPDVRAQPHTTPTYTRGICSYAISWVRGYLTIRPVFAPGNDSRSRTHAPRSHTLTSTAKSTDSEIKLRIRRRWGEVRRRRRQWRLSKGRFARLYDSQLFPRWRTRGEKRQQQGKEASKWLAYETTFKLTLIFFFFFRGRVCIRSFRDRKSVV